MPRGLQELLAGSEMSDNMVKRQRKAPRIFEPEKAPPNAWVRAAISAMARPTLPSQVTEREAREAWRLAEAAVAPIGFSQGGSLARRKAQRRRHQEAAMKPALSMSAASEEWCGASIPLNAAAHAREPNDCFRSRPLLHDIIDCVSEFSGIGALEHGLQAGFEEAGLNLRLLEASERDDCSSGRHNADVLKKRFDCHVLCPAERLAQPYPPSARLVEVTTLCANHSKWNPKRRPEETEELLKPVVNRLREAPGVEIVVFENVPEFLQVLDGQTRSSYTFWVDLLEERCGFTDHAYCLMPTSVAGDLHARTRLLSVHARGGRFSPAAALARHLIASAPCAADSSCTTAECQPEGDVEVFAFTSGLSEARASAKGGIIPHRDRLPAYNSNLNTVIFCQGQYWQASPWLASRASALPDAWQERLSSKPKTSLQASALANMVSPLQARELGHAIAAEWLRGDFVSNESVPALAGALGLPWQFKGRNPAEFPVVRARAGNKAAYVCFRASGERWKRIADGNEWLVRESAMSLPHLCQLAVRKGKLKPFRGATDLQRVAADESLSVYSRICAEKQLIRVQKATLARVEARLVAGREDDMCSWAQCEGCFCWRRIPSLAACPAPEQSWFCSMLPPPHNECQAGDAVEIGEVETSRLEPTFSEASDVNLVSIAVRMPTPSPVDLFNAVLASDELAFDYWLKSRTAARVFERARQLQASACVSL